MIYDFTVDGKPQGKGRPRFGKGRAYTQKSTIEYEDRIRQAFLDRYGNVLLGGDIDISITAVFSIPKSYTKKRAKAIVESGEYPRKKPDADNIAKAVLDALNGVAYEDDVQVVKLECKKIYSHQYGEEYEGLKITMEEVKDEARRL